MKKYKLEEIDHTADYGIKVWAEDKKTLFEKCAEIMENLIVETKEIDAKILRELKIEGENEEELLLELLKELLFIFDTEGFIFKEIKIEFEGEKKLKLVGKGDFFDPKKHRRKLTIKAVTYYNFYLKEKNGGFETQIIFDV